MSVDRDSLVGSVGECGHGAGREVRTGAGDRRPSETPASPTDSYGWPRPPLGSILPPFRGPVGGRGPTSSSDTLHLQNGVPEGAPVPSGPVNIIDVTPACTREGAGTFPAPELSARGISILELTSAAGRRYRGYVLTGDAQLLPETAVLLDRVLDLLWGER